MHKALCKCLCYKYLNHVFVKQCVPVCVKLTAPFCGGLNPAGFYIIVIIIIDIISPTLEINLQETAALPLA